MCLHLNATLDHTRCDNAATVAGIHRGVQRRILDINQHAIFMPCNNHSLSLAGVHAAGKNPRYLILIPDGVLNTDAVSALKGNLDQVITALEELRDGASENLATKGDAGALLTCTMSYTFIAYLFFWEPLLMEINYAQQYLQKRGLCLDQCATKMSSLSVYFTDERDALVSNSSKAAQSFCDDKGIRVDRRVRRQRRMPGEQVRDDGLTVKQETCRELLEIVDRLLAEVEKRSCNLRDMSDRFGFMQSSHLLNERNDERIEKQIQIFSLLYSEVMPESLIEEVKRLRRLMHSFQIDRQLLILTRLENTQASTVDSHHTHKLTQIMPNVSASSWPPMETLKSQANLWEISEQQEAPEV
ncbi:uncharacterized protein LOC134781062 [Penaeus indicus]|uniref:uncharacterized protein LOC134781062 n=1 Tax=Penaeus indicus TaxID=29960 RepID=UPI00300C13B3